MNNLIGVLMDFQSAFNLAVGIITFLGGWIIKSFSDNVRDLQVKVQDLQVMVAGQYVTHADLEKMINAVFNKLDKIEEKIDKKADK